MFHLKILTCQKRELVKGAPYCKEGGRKMCLTNLITKLESRGGTTLFSAALNMANY